MCDIFGGGISVTIAQVLSVGVGWVEALVVIVVNVGGLSVSVEIWWVVELI